MKTKLLAALMALTSLMAFAGENRGTVIETPSEADALVLQVTGRLVGIRILISEEKNLGRICYEIGKTSQFLSETEVKGHFVNAGTLQLKLNFLEEIMTGESLNGFCSAQSSSISPREVAHHYSTWIGDLLELSFR